MEQNNDIFLADGDALVYLANHCTKDIPQQLFGVIHLVHMHLMTDFSIPLPSFTHLYTFCIIPSIPPVGYLMDGLFFNQKINKNIRISYSLKCKHWKKILYEKINGSAG